MKDSKHEDFREPLHKLSRAVYSRKGENGKVAVIAGSKDYTGAPALSAKAALRTGSDLVKILVPEQIRGTVAGYSENFIVESYEADYFNDGALSQAFELAEWADAVVIGPGLGKPDKEAIKEFVSETRTPLVIDADAIEPAVEADISRAILTPHKQELKSVPDDIVDGETVVVRTGAEDKVFTKEEVYTGVLGSSAMTVGGTGDVLTGIIASLLSQRHCGFTFSEAARLGVWINGKVGEKAAEEYWIGALATDMVEEIPLVLRDQD